MADGVTAEPSRKGAQKVLINSEIENFMTQACAR
jgi:hypothetical protein